MAWEIKKLVLRPVRALPGDPVLADLTPPTRLYGLEGPGRAALGAAHEFAKVCLARGIATQLEINGITETVYTHGYSPRAAR